MSLLLAGRRRYFLVFLETHAWMNFLGCLLGWVRMKMEDEERIACYMVRWRPIRQS